MVERSTSILFLKILGDRLRGTLEQRESESRSQVAGGLSKVVMLVSLTNDDVTHNITLDWYEHTNKSA